MPRIRTGYSFREAAGDLPEVISRMEEIGYADAFPITDRASTFAWSRWNKLIKAKGAKPVFGVELAVSPEVAAKKPIFDHWTFIAKDSVAPINRLVGIATNQFRYRPLLTIEQALEASEEAFVIFGNRTNPDSLGSPRADTFLGMGPSTPRGQLRRARALGWGVVAVSDNRFPREDDVGFYEVLCGIKGDTQSYTQHLLSDAEWSEVADVLGATVDDKLEAYVNRTRILEGSTAGLVEAELLKPEHPATLLDMCTAGAADLGVDLEDPVYKARLERELSLIAEKDFEDYFYIVAEMCQWSRERMIVGPARGSSCGSLVCYLLKITTVDPIPFGLIFERFIDINRDDLPDIDIDFSDQQRHLVFEHAAEIYGADHVARLGTVAKFQPRSALQEVGAALRLPPWKCTAVVESLIERSSGDSRALNSLEDTLMTMPAGKTLLHDHPEAIVAARFEGHPRHYSQHAAGIVIGEKPISEYVAVDNRTGATMCDKKDAEDLNLLKIDALGLKQLSVFEDTLEMAGLPRDHLEKLPLDDPEAFEVLNREQWSGVFQFNGMALQGITRQFKVDKFDDIVSVTALGRPGPLASGGAHEWVRRRNGVNPVTYPHEIFEPFLNDTMGIVLYQEQVMEIGRQIGGLSWGDVTALRKAMSKSLGKEYFDQFGDPWKKGAIAKGVDPERADKVWDDLCAYGAWSFNKSHSVAYGLISYWCCWLKAHHPFEFAAATLSHEKDAQRQIQVLREMVAEGYDYVPVDEEHSTDRWAVGWREGKKVLVGPLTSVRGIGPKMVSQIMSAKARGEPMPERAKKLLANPKTDVDSIWPIRDAFKKVLPDPSARNIHTPPTSVEDAFETPNDKEILLFVTPAKINPRDENEAVMVARRGGKEIKDGKTTSLNLQLRDDTGTIFGKVNRFKYNQVGKDIVDRGKPNKALYAVKGRLWGDNNFRGVSVDMVRYIGNVDGTVDGEENAEA